MLEANKAVARRWLDDFWSAGDLTIVDEIYAPNCVRHDPEGAMVGQDAVRGFVAGIRAEFPDLHFTADDVIAEGDRVVVRYTATGTHAPTGRRITFPGMDILRIQEGKIVESWPGYDNRFIEKQLGATPQPGQRGT